VTAKTAATLDHVSGGRLNLGIGAGWFELERKAFGIDFKTVPARLPCPRYRLAQSALCAPRQSGKPGV
jgi:alkanesulfonate monooxygenase SsuD/methylene tetrahydromethanopterin reductase-like flavin-dependent oxidoreductase (luciferase family)